MFSFKKKLVNTVKICARAVNMLSRAVNILTRAVNSKQYPATLCQFGVSNFRVLSESVS